MTAALRQNLAGWLIAGLWAAAPLYPSFVALMPVAPPGYSLLSPIWSASLLALVLVAILSVLALLIADGGVSLLKAPLQKSIWIYAGCTVCIALFGLAPGFGLLYALFVVSTGIGMTALVHWGPQPAFARLMRYAMLSSSGIAALLTLGLWVLRWPAELYAVGNGRAIGCFVVPGELAGYMGMFLPYALGVGLTSRVRTERFLAWTVAVCDGLAMAASLSRAGLVGLALGLALLVSRYGRRWCIGYLVFLGLAVLLIGHHHFDLRHNPAEDTNRFAIWIAALRVAVLFPLFGVGPGGFAHVYSLVRLPDGEPVAFHAHSLLLSTFAETGIIGFWALAQLWVRFAAEFRTAYRSADSQGKTLGLAVAAGFVGTWLQSSIDVVQILVLGLWIPFMGVALLALRKGASAELGPISVLKADFNPMSGLRSMIVLTLGLGVLCGCGPHTQQAVAKPTPVASVAPMFASAAPSTAPTVLVTPTAMPDVILHARRSGTHLVSILVVQGKRRLYTIDADSNETERTSEGNYHSSFIKPVLIFFNQDGTKMRATSAKAEVDGTSKVVLMLGNVRLLAQDGTTLQCDRMRYDDRNNQVEGWSNVVITTHQGDTLRGEHLVGDLHLEHVHIDGVDQGP